MEIRLELPFRGENESGGVGKKTVSRFMLTLQGDVGSEVLNQLIYFLKPKDKQIVIWAFNSFVPLEKIAVGMDIEMLGKHEACIVHDSDIMKQILRRWEAEEHIIFYACKENTEEVLAKVLDYERQWWRFRGREGIEGYLFLLDKVDTLIFYSNSHHSIDIFSSENNVINALREVVGKGSAERTAG